LDIGDIDGAQKATKMYETMMKAGKWTAQQNKEEGNDAIDSIGELVAICERDGFIPKYFSEGPKDKADRVLQDMKIYTKDLIESETGLTTKMERALVQIEEEEARIKAAAEMGDDAEEEAMFNYDKPVFELEDYSEFKDFEAELSEEDQEYLASLLDEEEE
jgi:polyhydroxyalkanoate synthesis regulator phasin